MINKSNNKEMNFRERDIEDIRKEYFEIRELVESIDIKNKFKGEWEKAGRPNEPGYVVSFYKKLSSIIEEENNLSLSKQSKRFLAEKIWYTLGCSICGSDIDNTWNKRFPGTLGWISAHILFSTTIKFIIPKHPYVKDWNKFLNAQTLSEVMGQLVYDTNHEKLEPALTQNISSFMKERNTKQ